MQTLVLDKQTGLQKPKQLGGHPVGLYVLFLTETWERFSYYGMRVLLVLYLTKHLLVEAQTGTYVFGYATIKAALEAVAGPLSIQPLSSLIYGNYTGLVYLTPILGGMLADRVLGARKTVILGGVLMAIGHFLMASESLFFIALFFLIIGNGCFKPNISTQVGSLYAPEDPRRDRAFLIFYMGVNLGAFLSPFICGTLGQIYGWHYGFAAAGVGMLIGLFIYLWGQKYLAPESLKPKETKAERAKKHPLNSREKGVIAALIALCALNIVFWGVYEQQGNTLQLFADSNTDWRIFNWEMPSTWFQAMNPLFIMFTPALSALWAWQARRGKEPSSINKMGWGCIILGISFVVLTWATSGMQAGQRISFIWLLGCTLIYTIGELYLSPVGLSLVSRVAPARLVGMMMGIWFLSSFFGNQLSGIIGIYYERMSKENFFLLLAGLSIVSGLAIFALAGPIKRAIGEPSK